MSSNPYFFLPFYLPALMVSIRARLNLAYLMQCMRAFIHLSYMHRARRIILTASVLQFQIEYMNQLVASHMPYLG